LFVQERSGRSMNGIAPRRGFVRLGVVERRSWPIDDDDARLCFAQAMAWPRFGLDLSAVPGDEVQKRVAELAKALYQRTNWRLCLPARSPSFVVVAADVRLSVPRRCPGSRAR
jgi:hypothetical protein